MNCELFVYDIKRCGLFLPNNPEPSHLHTNALFNDLKRWAVDSNKPLVETSTFSANKRFLESFCIGITHQNGQYLVALWNKVPHTKSGVALVNGASSANNATVTHSPIDEGDIPGYPTFFWILPSSNIMVSIKLENPSLGIGQFREYMKGFLHMFNSHVVHTEDENGEKIQGYADFPKPLSGPDNRIINHRLFASFKLSARTMPGEQESILERHHQVIKLVKDVHVYNNLQDRDASMVERIRQIFNDLEPVKKKTARVTMPVSLSIQDTQELIDLYNQHDHSEEYDVGFVFSGKSSHIEWLSGSQKKEEIELDVIWKAEGQPDLDDLLLKLQNYTYLLSNPSNTDNEDASHEEGRSQAS